MENEIDNLETSDGLIHLRDSSNGILCGEEGLKTPTVKRATCHDCILRLLERGKRGYA